MSGSNCCFLTCIQVSQEAGKVVWDFHLLKNFLQFFFFFLMHTIKGFSIVNEAKVDFFSWNSLAFSIIQMMLAISSLDPLPFLNPALTSGSVVHIQLKPKNLCHLHSQTSLGQSCHSGKNFFAPMHVGSLKSCPTLCNPVGCGLPGFSVRGFSRQEYWSVLANTCCHTLLEHYISCCHHHKLP